MYFCRTQSATVTILVLSATSMLPSAEVIITCAALSDHDPHTYSCRTQAIEGAAAVVNSPAGRAALTAALRRPETAEPLLLHVTRAARALRPCQAEMLVSTTPAEPNPDPARNAPLSLTPTLTRICQAATQVGHAKGRSICLSYIHSRPYL